MLVVRTKLVPDFALTTHFLHLVVVTVYSGRVPRHAMWWAAMAASSALAVALGVWGCRWRELRPISFGGGGGGGGEVAASANGTADVADRDGGCDEGDDGDAEQGFARGRGRGGRGRNGAGEYEMVKMRGDEG